MLEKASGQKRLSSQTGSLSLHTDGNNLESETIFCEILHIC